ncbi:hypothetical protein [Mycobacterium tuberculosis]|uniref:hypothetical protein n=1 Tax=Mycobacterium tuberculosis TaxID=1773 RepID=UPI00272B723A|nr:hypothetical protein [Mycobacterium tuberculosis]
MQLLCARRSSPLQPSVFDIFATRDFLDEIKQHAHKGMQVGIVGMRVDARTLSADRLKASPLQPSVFDIFATRDFLDEIKQHAHKGMQVGIGCRPAYGAD